VRAAYNHDWLRPDLVDLCNDRIQWHVHDVQQRLGLHKHIDNGSDRTTAEPDPNRNHAAPTVTDLHGA
jgi:hypothetical protein